MKQLGYYFFKYSIFLGLFFYFKKIKISGLENIPLNKPTLLLSNHQNALLDVLLIATRSNLKPWYLTRSDIFKSKLFSPLFYFLQMLPIYRLRDGKDTLSKNQAIFNRCGQLLNNNETLLIFPEANHNLKRRVRPLSKGFTRLIFNAFKKNLDLDLQLVPVGQNYNNAEGFPDSTALYFGKPILVQDILTENYKETALQLKTLVTNKLKKLTTHIKDETTYNEIQQQLIARNVDFLNPIEANDIIRQWNEKQIKKPKKSYEFLNTIVKYFFILVNLPIVFVWRKLIKPKVPEPEFMSTFRFVFSMLVYPFFYMIIWFGTWNFIDFKVAFLSILVHLLVNLIIIKSPFLIYRDTILP